MQQVRDNIRIAQANAIPIRRDALLARLYDSRLYDVRLYGLRLYGCAVETAVCAGSACTLFAPCKTQNSKFRIAGMGLDGWTNPGWAGDW